MQLQSVKQITSRPITWFWPGRFARTNYWSRVLPHTPCVHATWPETSWPISCTTGRASRASWGSFYCYPLTLPDAMYDVSRRNIRSSSN
jgi:hypothetical protein